MSGYDIIGDIHADAGRLRLLLAQLGYTRPHFTHPDGRRPIYLGDYINRGDQNKEVIDIVQETMEEGAEGVMGNHEFKAICYSKPGIHGYIRPHTLSNTAEHAGFLREYPYDSDAYKRVVAWFERLPVMIEKPEFRVVHACWNDAAIKGCEPHIRKKDGTLRRSAYRAYDTENPTPFNQSLDILLKGPRFKLPRGVNYQTSEGHPGKEPRVLWWKDKALPAADLIEKGEQVRHVLSDSNERGILNLRNKFNYASKQIVFIGHYNILEIPKITSAKVACLNFKGRLVAYRWNEGDKALNPDRLVYV